MFIYYKGVRSINTYVLVSVLAVFLPMTNDANQTIIFNNKNAY